MVYLTFVRLTSMAEKHPLVKKNGKNGSSRSGGAGNHRHGRKVWEFGFQFNLKNIFIGLFIAFILFSMLGNLGDKVSNLVEKPLTTVITDVKDGKIEKIEIEDSRLTVFYKDGGRFLSHKEPQESLLKVFEGAGVDPKAVEVKVKDLSPAAVWLGLISNVLPLVLTVVFFLFLFRQARGAQDNIFSFGQSRARVFQKDLPKVTFANVAGVDEAKKELEEVVDFLKNPNKYKALGARTPKGVILVGPSGTGKTLLAKAMAGEAHTAFYSVAGSEFMEMLVGIGAARTRDLFAQAKKNAPSIIFIDEIDAIGRMRSVGLMGGHDEREQTLNQILVEMDGFEPNTACLVVAASVIGDTPVLIKDEHGVKLLPIGTLVDQWYTDENEEGEKDVWGIDALGLERKSVGPNLNGRLFFAGSAFKHVSSVFRHKVSQIYEIEYLGGKICATGNHSVFIRSPKGLVTKAVRELAPGDVLIDLPYKANRGSRKHMEIRKHRFDTGWHGSLPVYDQDAITHWQPKYLYALEAKDTMSQSQIAKFVGVSQGTVSHWQRGIGGPRAISQEYVKHAVPERVDVTPELCRLFGYYVAEGYARWEVDFCFSVEETDLIDDVMVLMKSVFGLHPDRVRRQTHGAVNIVYASAPAAHFFVRHCGKGAHQKHVPPFLFEAPYEHFREFLRGVFAGDGYDDRRGKGEITSVSKQLIIELNWICRMHGMKTYIHSFTAKEGRRIAGGKPLRATVAYRLGWGRANHPFHAFQMKKTYPVKRAIVKRVRKLPYDGFVYDLCGVDNEAFFGGDSPLLLHNTNRGDLLDPALIRPGRFDRRIVLDLPDMAGRKDILAIHAKGKPFAATLDWDKVAKRTVGFSGADLENMLNEAAILAARENKKEIDYKDIEEAATKVKLGPEKKRLQSDLDRKMTAYHEAGHAVVNYYSPALDPVHRVSIVSRGMALGYTMAPPEKDRLHETKSRLIEEIAMTMGGRAAEQLIFHEMTSGAANDIDQATRIARYMVMEFGMSELGPINFGPHLDVTEWGKQYMQETQISPDMAANIDREVKKLIDEGYRKAAELLKKHKKKLDQVAAELVKKETLESEEFAALMGGDKKRAN